MILLIAVIVASVLADQITKQLVLNFLDREESFDLISGVLRFTYVENRGAAFGMLDDKRWIFMTVSVVAIVALAVYLFRYGYKNKCAAIGIALIIGGGIGNMIDRIFLGYVVDFIDFCAFPDIWMWVFNVADACVCVGAGMVVLFLAVDVVREAKAEKLAKAKTVETAENPEGEKTEKISNIPEKTENEHREETENTENTEKTEEGI